MLSFSSWEKKGKKKSWPVAEAFGQSSLWHIKKLQLLEKTASCDRTIAIITPQVPENTHSGWL